MERKFKSGRRNFLGRIRFSILYIALQVRIFLVGSFLSRKGSLKKTITLFLGFLFVMLSLGHLRAETPQSPWPWTLSGESFQISNNSGNDFWPSITSNGELYFVVWSRKTSNGYDIYGIIIDRDGKRMLRTDNDGNETGESEIPICTEPNDQMYPVASWNGENFLVVWQDKRNGKWWDIYGARVTPGGNVLDSDLGGFRISQGRSNLDQVGPAIAYGGENHLVVWQGKRNIRTWNIFFAIVSKDGEVLVKPALLDPNVKDQTSPAVGFDGTNYLVVWQDKRNAKSWDIYGAGLTQSGDLIDWGQQQNPFQITDTQGFDRLKPVVAWNGNYYWIAWTNIQDKMISYLSGRRISPEGSVLDLSDIVFQSDGSNKAYPDIAPAGSDFLLIWEQDPEGKTKVCGASIQSQYHVSISEPGFISTSGEISNLSFPAVAVIENDALVVWQDGPDQNNAWNIFGQIISKAQPPVPPGPDGIGGQP
jgi:large repetitive protein